MKKTSLFISAVTIVIATSHLVSAWGITAEDIGCYQTSIPETSYIRSTPEGFQIFPSFEAYKASRGGYSEQEDIALAAPMIQRYLDAEDATSPRSEKIAKLFIMDPGCDEWFAKLTDLSVRKVFISMLIPAASLGSITI